MKNAQGPQNAVTVTKTKPKKHTTLSIEDALYLGPNKNSLPSKLPKNETTEQPS